MRSITLLFFLFTALNLQAQDDLILQVNDTILEITTGREYQLPVNGKLVTISVETKDTLRFDGNLFSFNYLNDYKISKTKIDAGIEQMMIMSAEGSGILIQEYSTMDPTMLNEMMINEVTKESINYGYEMKREDYTRTLASGETLEVARAVLTYRGETNIYEVATLGEKDQGILLMTMVMDDTKGAQGTQIIDLMWNSLEYK